VLLTASTLEVEAGGPPAAASTDGDARDRLTRFASSKHRLDMTHSQSTSGVPAIRLSLRRLWRVRATMACQLVAVLALAACSANDPDSGARSGPDDSGARDTTESNHDVAEKAKSGADSEVSSLLDCNSAKPPKGDLETFIATCRARAASERGKSGPARTLSTATAALVYDSRTTVAGLDFANVPTWSDADILAQFESARDERYLTQTFPPDPDFQRRISWLFPDDGCFARAEQLDVRVARAGKARPHKLFAFGPLRVYTDNASSGRVGWWYHVVPVVKNSSGEPIVLDAAVNPCKPLPYLNWLALMVDDMAAYDDLAEGNGVALGDSWSYDPFSLSSGEPSHSAESLDTLQGIFLYSEWSRQSELGRDPNLVLGATPPWSGSSCL
jgi:hypothetical protein